QGLLQEYAAASRVQVSRVDVASAPDTTPNVGPGATSILPMIPATVAGTGDVYGLTDLLARVERGPRLLLVTDLSVQSVRGPRVRWAPPPVDTMPPGLAPEPAAAEPERVVEPPRFYGTMTDAGGPAALLRFPGAPNAQLYHQGDRAGAWRVGRITADRVTVAA